MIFIFFISFILIFKKTTAEAFPFPVFYGSSIDLSKFKIYKNITIQGGENNQFLGYAVSKTLCDINGDHFNDLVIYANNSGSISKDVFVIFGSNTGFSNTSVIDVNSLNGSNGFHIHFDDDNKNYGPNYVECLGDMNKDGASELGIGASNADPQFNGNANGTLYVIYGNSKENFPAFINLAFMTSKQGFYIQGNRGLGFGFAKLGDIDGDGYEDIAVSQGNPFILTGRPIFPEKVFIEDIPINIYLPNYNSCFGTKISGDFDINNDGFKDILIGSDCAVFNETNIQGMAIVVFGKKNFKTIDASGRMVFKYGELFMKIIYVVA